MVRNRNKRLCSVVQRCDFVWSGAVTCNGRLSIPAHVDRPLTGGTHSWCGRKHRSPRARRLVRHDRAVCSEHVAVMGRGGVITWEAEISQVSCAGGECYVPRLASGLGRGLLDPGSQTVKRNQFVRNRTRGKNKNGNVCWRIQVLLCELRTN